MATSPIDMVKKLLKNGFVKVSQKGSHMKLFNPTTNITTVVPIHVGTLGKGLERRILKEAGLLFKKEKDLKSKGEVCLA